jgi:hypothetical protein
MRRLFLDQFEFDNFASEESLEIHLAAKIVTRVSVTPVVQFRDVAEFVTATNGPGSVEDLSEFTEFTDCGLYSSVREYLKRFANIDVPNPCNWKMCILFQDDLDFDAVFDTPSLFIRYHWLSTA